MIQLTPQMRILVAVEPADFRKGIDGLARVCKDVLQHDPFSGWVFVFRNRRAKAIKMGSFMVPPNTPQAGGLLPSCLSCLSCLSPPSCFAPSRVFAPSWSKRPYSPSAGGGATGSSVFAGVSG